VPPQQYSQKTVNTFIKGLYTEASVMTYPENTSSDELNFDLLIDGSRRRRRGIAYEDNYQNSTFAVASGDLIHNETWTNVSGIGGTEFLVVQHNNMVYFYDKSLDTISAGQKSFSIDLNNYSANNSYSVSSTYINTASVTGYLIIVSPAIDPIRVEYIPNDDNITVSKIKVQIRDLEYLGMSSNITFISRTSNLVTVTVNTPHYYNAGDTVEIDSSIFQFNGTFTLAGAPTSTTMTYTLAGANFSSTAATGLAIKEVAPETPPAAITNNYLYDLFNQGWYSDNNGRSGNAFDYWDNTRTGDFPPRNKSWWVGKNTSNDQDIDQYLKIEYGNTLAPNGHFILDFFNQNRSAASSINNLTTVVETARFNSVAPYAGRVWYAGLDSSKNGGKIFYSKTIESEKDFGLCYQKEDPTSEDTPGLVDSDGGYIIIPEASSIQALFTTGSILYVLAANGVWVIGGVDQVFKATEYYVSKISSFGISSKRTLINVADSPVYWDTSGIYTVAIKESTPFVTSMSDNIRSFYDAISPDKKKDATAVFDRLGKRIIWMYSSETETIANKKTKILIYDLNLQAFFPWEISNATEASPYLYGGFFLSGLGSSEVAYNILVGADQVIDASSNTVVETISSSSASNSDTKFFVRTDDGYLTVANFTDRAFLDWGSANYSSYAETAYDFSGSAMLKKNVPYIVSYMRRTEENFIPVNEGYVADYPSGCIFTVKWDLSVDSSRWSTPSQIYRMVNYPTVDINDLTFTYPYDTIVARTKIRGKGRVLRMRFESETGKDLNLIGWETVDASNTSY
jgi:hypothetical protein